MKAMLPSLKRFVCALVIAVQLGTYAASQVSLWTSWHTAPPAYQVQYQGFLNWVPGQIPGDAAVAFVTPADDGYLGDYFALSNKLYPRAVWWLRSGPCARARTWCIPAGASPEELRRVLGALHIRYVIAAGLELALPVSTRLEFDEHLAVLELE